MIALCSVFYSYVKLETIQCSLTGEWINKMWNIHKMEYHLEKKIRGTIDTPDNVDESQNLYAE